MVVKKVKRRLGYLNINNEIESTKINSTILLAMFILLVTVNITVNLAINKNSDSFKFISYEQFIILLFVILVITYIGMNLCSIHLKRLIKEKDIFESKDKKERFVK